MALVETTELVLVTLRSSSRERDGYSPVGTEHDRSKSLSTIAEAVGSSQYLSGTLELLTAIETLREEGLVTRESTVTDEQFHLTDEGDIRAQRIFERLRETDVELVTDEGRKRVTLESAAAQTGRPLVELAAECTDDGVCYVHEETPQQDLVGRSDELDQCTHLVERVRSTGRGEALFLVGPAGIGKTALADRLLTAVSADADADVVRVRCRSTDRPYQPIRDALAQVETAETPFRSPGPTVEDADTYQAQQMALFEVVTRMLATEEELRVLCFDALEHADVATRTYLSFLLEQVDDIPVVLAGSYQPSGFSEEELVDGPTCDESRITRVVLDPLDRDATRQLIEQTVGHRSAPDAFVDAMYEHTGGNPLFVEETVESLLETNQLDERFEWYPESPAEIDLPDEVHETLSYRFSMLDETAKQLLDQAAVAGASFRVDAVAACCDVDESRAQSIVDLLVEASVLVHSEKESLAEFRSNALREAVLDSLDERTRTESHAALAAQLETAFETNPEEGSRLAADIAHHHEQAEQVSAAIEWYRRGAADAIDVYAHEQAVDYYYRILTLARQIEDHDAIVFAADRLATVYTTTGEYDRARKHVQFLRERVPDDEHRWRQRIAERAGTIDNDCGDHDAAIDEATTALELDGASSEERCRLLGVLAAAQYGKGEFGRARETARRQLELARELDAPALEADAHDWLARISLQQGRFDSAREGFEQRIDICQRLGDRQGVGNSLLGLGSVAHRTGEFESATEQFHRSFEIFEEIRDRHSEARSLLGLGVVADKRGDLEQAREYYQRSLDHCRTIGDRKGEAKALGNLGVLAKTNNDFEAAQQYYQESLDIFETLGDVHGKARNLNNLGEVALNRDEFDRAQTYFEWSLDIKRALGDRQGQAGTIRNLGDLALERGEAAEARRRYEQSLDIARDVAVPRERGKAMLGLGRLERRNGNPDRARTHLEAARDTFEKLDASHLHSRCQHLLESVAVEADSHTSVSEQ